MKDIELRLMSELMKNSRRSDRELAKALGVSQPTVSRTIKKLEEEGYIKEYTMIPDFSKLGYKIRARALNAELTQNRIANRLSMKRSSILALKFAVTEPLKSLKIDVELIVFLRTRGKKWKVTVL